MSEGSIKQIYDKEFAEQGIALDGRHFVRCRFTRCQLSYQGLSPVTFDSCTFTECRWSFEGPAGNALAFLGDIYNGLDIEGRQLVESVFESIRSGEVRNSDTPITPIEQMRRGVGV